MTYPVIHNPVTRGSGIVRQTPTDQHPTLIADLYDAPGAAVAGEHVHPHSTESITTARALSRITGFTDRTLTAGWSAAHPANYDCMQHLSVSPMGNPQSHRPERTGALT